MTIDLAITIDNEALKRAGISPNPSVTLYLNDAPLAFVKAWLADALRLEFVFDQNGDIRMTTLAGPLDAKPNH